MKPKEDAAKVALAVASAFALAYVVYNLVESVRYNGFFLTRSTRKNSKPKKKGELITQLELLESVDRSNVLVALAALLQYSAFTEIQKEINKLGYLPKIVALLKHSDEHVVQQTALLVNNLALNEENQAVLKSCIPQLTHLISKKIVNAHDMTSIEFTTTILQALTNLTTFNESHKDILPHVHVLYNVLQGCTVIHVKLQVLKILVNISTNKRICENMLEFDAQLIRCMELYIGDSVNEAILLRAVTCCANVLESLHRRWRHGSDPTPATPEFVSEKTQEDFLKFSLHANEDIRQQSRRCVAALRTPVTPTSSAHSMDELDILQVLEL